MTETIICMKDLELKKFYKYVDISYSFGYNIESGIRNTKMASACGSSLTQYDSSELIIIYKCNFGYA